MKRRFGLALLVVWVFLLSACSAGQNEQTIAGPLPEILDHVYDTVEVDDATRDFLKTGLVTTDVSSEQIRVGLGLDSMPDAEIVASQPSSKQVPFYACLMRISGGGDMDLFKESLQKAAVRLWPHAQEDVCVEQEGDLILLVMADEAEKYMQAFSALA